MTLPSSGSPISFSQLRAEFGTDGNNTNGPVRIGQYRRDDPSFTDKTAGTFVDQPIDTGVPTSGTIAMEDLQGKSLNVIVDYHSGSADEGGTRPEDARTRYNSGSGSGKWTVIGGYKTPPSDSGGTKVKINVNKGIGGQASASETAKCSLRTGTWDTNTMLSVDMGSSGKIRGAGGDGGTGGGGDGSPGEDANSGLGIQYSGTTVNIASGGQIICGYGGGGGGGDAYDEDGLAFFDQERYSGGGGGGGGAGVPAGAGGTSGDGENGEAGSAPAGGEEGGAGGAGANDAGEAVAGNGGRGGDEEGEATSGSDGSGGSGEGDGGGIGEQGWAIRKSASGVTWTLNNNGSITGDQASTSSGGGGTTVS